MPKNIANTADKAACKQSPGVIVPLVNFKRCEGKADCVAVCPENVFEIRRIDAEDYEELGFFNKFKLRVHGMQVAYTPNADACRAWPVRKSMPGKGNYADQSRISSLNIGNQPDCR